MIKKTSYVDETTGEVLSHKSISVGSRFDDEKGYLFRNQKHGFKQFFDIPFPEELTDAEIGKLTKLAKHIYKDTNFLAYRGNGGIKSHTPETMKKIINMTSDRQINDFLKKMIRLGMIAKSTREVGGITTIDYYLNPLYFFSGRRINTNLYLLFREQLDHYIPKWAQSKFLEKKVDKH